MGRPQAENRLAKETSPYLLQHANNPVDWYPWGAEALLQARERDRPILLSVGYAACHWCHVMERESFSDARIAKLMNERFVCVKVDREERPDIDEIYMKATVAMNGSGGWPMTVFLMPDGRPFFAGTYFPPQDAGQRPGFETVLKRLAELWDGERDTVEAQAAELTNHLRAITESPHVPSALSGRLADDAVSALAEVFDAKHGGFSKAPKFPPHGSLSLLLRYGAKTGDPQALQMAQRTLDGMMDGGIYDHLGGGFARYSTDETWHVPHFEKMLYDNAQLAKVYLLAFQVLGDTAYRRIAEDTLDYIEREMQSTEGGYFSATDADSEGVEGKYFVFSRDEVVRLLDRDEAELFCLAYDVTDEGNWEGTNVLRRLLPWKLLVEQFGDGSQSSEAQIKRTLEQARTKLLSARSRRIPPLTDDKILTSWNGLMIGAMACGARILNNERYVASAERAAAHVLEKMTRPDGRLYRTYREGRAHLDAYLEDYAFMADALVDLFEAGQPSDPRWLHHANDLAARMVSDFGDGDGGAFYFTAHEHEKLIVRARDGADGPLPNANAAAARALVRLSFHLNQPELRARAADAVGAYGRVVQEAPRAFSSSIEVVEWLAEPPIEVAIVGDKSPMSDRLRGAIAKVALPHAIFADARLGTAGPGSSHPLLDGKLEAKVPQVHVCRAYACQAPATTPETVEQTLLEAVRTNHREARRLARTIRSVEGRASPAATRAWSEQSELAVIDDSYRTVRAETDTLTISRFGLEAPAAPNQASADFLRTALQKGINLVDASAPGGSHRAQRWIGNVLNEAFAAGDVSRDRLVVLARAGLIRGDDHARALKRRSSGRYRLGPPDVIELSDAIWYSVHPSWIDEQLARARMSLGLAAVDFLVLDPPESLLAKSALGADETLESAKEQLVRAFTHLDGLVADGLLHGYGVSSGSSDGPFTLELLNELAVRAHAAAPSKGDPEATQAMPKRPGFSLFLTAINLLEPGAAQTSPIEDVAIIATRPLLALVDGVPHPLADIAASQERDPPTEGTEALLDALEAVEASYYEDLGQHLRTRTSAGERSLPNLLAISGAMRGVVRSLPSLLQHEEMEAELRSLIAQRVQTLDRSLPHQMLDAWQPHRTAYLLATEAVLATLRRDAANRAHSVARGLRAELADSDVASDRPIARVALAAALQASSVKAVVAPPTEALSIEDVEAALTSHAELPIALSVELADKLAARIRDSKGD